MIGIKSVRCSRRFQGVFFLISLICSLWLSHIPVIGEVVNARPDANKLVQQGVELYQAGDFLGAIKRWQTALNIYQKTNNLADKAIVQENLAMVHQQMGQMEKSVADWEQVIAYYRQVGDKQQLGRSLTQQAQAYSSLGQSKKAITLLCNPDEHNNCARDSVLQIASAANDTATQAAALGSLGDAYRLTGKYTSAIATLQNSLKLTQELNNPTTIALATNSLGNAYSSQAQINYRRAESAAQSGDNQYAPEKFRSFAKQQDALALKYLRQSLEVYRNQKDEQGEMRASLSLIPIYYRTKETAFATATVQQAINLLESLPNNRARVYATIDLARLLPSHTRDGTPTPLECITPDSLSRSESLLNQAIAIAQGIQDFRAKSFALGQLGHVYECRNQYSQALSITQKAILAAEKDLKAQDSVYLWEWQTGRILKAQGKNNAATSAYEQAIATLETIRSDILTANRDIQFDFRDTIEPIYRDLVELKLSLAPTAQTSSKLLAGKDDLSSILKTIDSLKLAEIQNFFGNDCNSTIFIQKQVDSVADKATAVFSTIIFDDKTVIILILPDGTKKYSWYSIKRQNLVKEIIEFRRKLQTLNLKDYEIAARHIYDWMICPFAQDLQQAKIKTLVFIHDGILRSVPMSALHDGKQFLIEQYAIATTPSLSLTDPKPLNRKALRVLALGLSDATSIDDQVFPPLEYVKTEITGVTQQIPGKQLLNQDFTSDRLEKELSQGVYPIIHIATHGKFGTDPEDNFIVTGDKQKLTFNELDQLIHRIARNTKSLELLTLTACETAVGNERSTLGLAGVAVQAGAKSALATLWAINDPVTAQIATDFYAKLLSDPKVSKAEALQAAQKAMIEGKKVEGRSHTHPVFWSPFILIGNWL